MTRFALAALLFAACGGDDGGGVTADAAKTPDAATNKVVAVTCPTTADATVMTTNGSFSFMPAATPLALNGVVKFVMSSEHNVVPNTIAPMTDPGLMVNFGETKCLKFTAVGTFGFACGPHSFAGTVTVQ
ncbi:MAG TPA: plastocyanin/azurin family copper-binding protein [Kofleriaceae bacterium]